MPGARSEGGTNINTTTNELADQSDVRVCVCEVTARARDWPGPLFKLVDAAEALEGGCCGRLDTITLVDTGGAETTVRRGSTVTRPGPSRAGTGPELDAVAAVLEAQRNDAHRRGVKLMKSTLKFLRLKEG